MVDHEVRVLANITTFKTLSRTFPPPSRWVGEERCGLQGTGLVGVKLCPPPGDKVGEEALAVTATRTRE